MVEGEIMIIRLIDIVLIVLFGFIVISDIDIKGAIPLPRQGEAANLPPQRKVAVYVEIDGDGRFHVFLQNGIVIKRNEIAGLESLLIEMKQRILERDAADMAVIIRPHEMSPIQSTVDVLDLCSRNQFPKNIARKSMALF